jgi:hypothetical protein
VLTEETASRAPLLVLASPSCFGEEQLSSFLCEFVYEAGEGPSLLAVERVLCHLVAPFGRRAGSPRYGAGWDGTGIRSTGRTTAHRA